MKASQRPSRNGGKLVLQRFLKTILVLDILAAVPVLLLAVFNVVGPERWWLTGMLQFLPMWPWAVPAGILVVPTLLAAKCCSDPRRGRLLSLVPLLSALWVLGPIMGLCVPVPADGLPPWEDTRVRVLTYNVKWGRRGDPGAIAREIIGNQPDLVLLQDAGEILEGDAGRILTPENGWTVRRSGQYVIASRWNLSELTEIDISVSGTAQHAVQAVVTPPEGNRPITVINAHLWTPRDGLAAIRNRNRSGLEANIEERGLQAVRLAVTVRQTAGPVLLTGDLNAPPYSRVHREFRSAGLRNAFEKGGFGYGYTYGASTRAGRPYVRLDHVLVSRDFRIGSARVGNRTGSEHCPVIADIYLPSE